MRTLKLGERLRSAVCSTEVMVVSAPQGQVNLTCGGAPMISGDEAPPSGASLDPGASAGTALGKRYVDSSGTLEVLCVKPGDGSLAVDGEALVLKEAKPLPASD